MTDTEDENIFRSLGVEPIINCRGTFTIIGGSIERPEVLTAMQAASKHFVQYDELAEGVGKRLAEITGAEWGMIPDGCAAVVAAPHRRLGRVRRPPAGARRLG